MIPPYSPIVIMTAMKGEADPIIAKLEMKPENLQALGIPSPIEIYKSTIQGKPVFLTYNGVDPTYKVDRVGTLHAVRTATIVAEKLKPHLIISAGTAGNVTNYKAEDVIVSAETFTLCDTWISVSGYEKYSKGHFPFFPIPEDIIQQLGLKKGRIATSHSFDLTERDKKELELTKASVVEMETAGIGLVCQDHKIGLIGLRVPINPINDTESFEKYFNTSVKVLAEKTALIVEKLLELNLGISNIISYYILNEANIPLYLKQTANQFLEKFSNAEKTTIVNIGDGNLNNVFRITHTDTGESLILKQALPYAKILGEGVPLSSQRMLYEIRYFRHIHSILPTHIPKIHYSDENVMMVLCMQDLNTHQVLREGLFQGQQYPELIDHLTTFLTHTLFKTSQFHLSEKEFHTFSEKFHGNSLCELTRDYVFTLPFKQDSSNHLTSKFSSQFLQNTATLRRLFSSNHEALIHGDLHTGSLMINKTETFIIDSEFAFMGPMSFDIGILLANLITSWVSHQIQNRNGPYQLWLLETINHFFTQFNEKFSLLWKHDSNDILSLDDFTAYQIRYLQGLFSEAVGFAGLEICRRICGIAGVKEIRNLQNPDQKSSAEQLGLAIGCHLVENYSSIQSVENILEILRKYGNS